MSAKMERSRSFIWDISAGFINVGKMNNVNANSVIFSRMGPNCR